MANVSARLHKCRQTGKHLWRLYATVLKALYLSTIVSLIALVYVRDGAN
jgi:hypothetical protein